MTRKRANKLKIGRQESVVNGRLATASCWARGGVPGGNRTSGCCTALTNYRSYFINLWGPGVCWPYLPIGVFWV